MKIVRAIVPVITPKNLFLPLCCFFYTERSNKIGKVKIVVDKKLAVSPTRLSGEKPVVSRCNTERKNAVATPAAGPNKNIPDTNTDITLKSIFKTKSRHDGKAKYCKTARDRSKHRYCNHFLYTGVLHLKSSPVRTPLQRTFDVSLQ